MAKRSILTVQQVFDLYIQGVIGTKEFRNWLVKKDSDFADVRDPDVDNQIDALARRREQLLQIDDTHKPEPLDSQS